MRRLFATAVFVVVVGGCAAVPTETAPPVVSSSRIAGVWTVATVNGTSPLHADLTANFRTDSTFIGALGCNQIVTTWTVEGREVVLGPIRAITERGCDPELRDDRRVADAWSARMAVEELTATTLVLRGNSRISLVRK